MFSLLNLALPHRENKRTVSILFVKRAFSYSKLLAWKNWEAAVSRQRRGVCGDSSDGTGLLHFLGQWCVWTASCGEIHII